MQKFTGYLLIFLGLALVILAVLVSLGLIEIRDPLGGIPQASWWLLLLALLDKAPWFGVVGVFLIYAGIKLLGVKLPFEEQPPQRRRSLPDDFRDR